MSQDKWKVDLNKNENLDDGYFEFITDVSKKVAKPSKKIEYELRGKIRELLET